MNIIVYDLETQKTFAEVGGHDRQAQLLISYLGVYSYSQDKFFGFFESDLPKLERILLTEQPTIVGFNSISFDNRVLQPYFKQLKIHTLPQVDILAEIYERLGYRMKLESVAQATLGEGKSGSGLDAIRYYREGNLEALAKYCLDDVRLTRDLYNYGREHGFILYTAGGEVQRLPVSWGNPVTISQHLQQAATQHQRVEISYLQLSEAKREQFTTTIDILRLTNKTIEVYCHRRNGKCVYQIDRILGVKLTNEQYAYQAALL